MNAAPSTAMPRYARRPSGPARPRGPWKHGPIPVVGLIGGIGAGKSTAAAALAGRGVLVLDADAIGHALLDQRPARDQVVGRFGEGVLDRSGPEEAPPKVDRKALGRIVFAQPSARRDLERILHPRMRKTFEKAIARAVRRREAKGVVLDAAILLEAGWDELCDLVVFVDAPESQRLARLGASRGWDQATLHSREKAQLSLDEKRRRADYVLTNAGDPDALTSAAGQLWDSIVRPRPRRMTTRPDST